MTDAGPPFRPRRAQAHKAQAARGGGIFAHFVRAGRQKRIRREEEDELCLEEKTEERSKSDPIVDPSEVPSAWQQYCIDLGMSAERPNCYITGPPGSGKSFIIKRLKGVRCSMTGISAQGIQGETLHSTLGIAICELSVYDCAKSIRGRPDIMQNWHRMRRERLIIDEVSMMSAKIFEYIEHVARLVLDSTEFFGGIQLVMFGDFHQLPPVFDKNEKDKRWLFECDLWLANVKHKMTLTEVFRQREPEFLKMLKEARDADLSPQSIALLESLERPIEPPNGIRMVELHTKNVAVDFTNNYELRKLGIPPVNHMAIDKGSSQWARKKLDDGPYLKEVRLAIGAQVMCRKNYNAEGIYNGSCGVVKSISIDEKDFTKSKVIVQFANGKEKAMHLETYEVKDPSNPKHKLATRQQFPLILAWAITIHKSQGMTIDYLRVNLSNLFASGQGYVGLSRARTLGGLQVNGFVSTGFQVDPKVKRFQKTLTELGGEADGFGAGQAVNANPTAPPPSITPSEREELVMLRELRDLEQQARATGLKMTI